MQDLKYELLFEIDVQLEPPQMVGVTPHGTRQILYVKGGHAKGPKFNGEVLPGGGDWLLIRPDGVGELDVRASVRLENDQMVYVTYPGYIVLSPDAMNRVTSGEVVDPSEYYFRVTPRFETASDQYRWLNQIVAVGVGRVAPYVQSVSYRVYQIL